MRLLQQIPAFLVLGVSIVTPAYAQGLASERAASLRTQLAELEKTQSELRGRLEAIEENLKPENIERSLAGVGSTHPEELRAQRARQLELERSNVRNQLDQLEAKHSRLQASIVKADNDAYLQSAGVNAGSSISQTRGVRHRSHRHKTASKRRSKQSPSKRKTAQ